MLIDDSNDEELEEDDNAKSARKSKHNLGRAEKSGLCGHSPIIIKKKI